MKTGLTPIKAIRAKCLSCCCDSVKEVRECTVKDCPLYPYRMGKRPKPEAEKGGDYGREEERETR